MTTLTLEDNLSELERQIATASTVEKKRAARHLYNLIDATQQRYTPQQKPTLMPSHSDEDLLFDNVPL
ncbi:hypothetical protein [Roseovarius sp. Pro17]|uniref:hypothetical protein n=1 Tax=Roseovarius sp. Pro17 TaxID=3108175 RepID=UPI002D76ECB8|nr:hypothetical protein [Roseovarius sp. Pro17]